MNLENLTRSYYLSDNYNCAEALIRACNTYYGLNIQPEDMKMMAGFGAGMYTGSVCGGLTACIAALSKILVKEKAHEQEDLRPAVVKLTRNFRSLLGGTECRELKPVHFDKETRCLNTVLLAAQAMENTTRELGIEPAGNGAL